jgi:hypothetical protein
MDRVNSEQEAELRAMCEAQRKHIKDLYLFVYLDADLSGPEWQVVALPQSSADSSVGSQPSGVISDSDAQAALAKLDAEQAAFREAKQREHVDAMQQLEMRLKLEEQAWEEDFQKRAQRSRDEAERARADALAAQLATVSSAGT